jgi:hypothetical protein
MPLLDFQLTLPLLRIFLISILKPEQVLSVSRIRRQDPGAWAVSERSELIQFPERLTINEQLS